MSSYHSYISQMMSNAKIGEKNPILSKVPKTTSISRSIPSSMSTAKRDSMGTGCVKSECGSSKHGSASFQFFFLC